MIQDLPMQAIAVAVAETNFWAGGDWEAAVRMAHSERQTKMCDRTQWLGTHARGLYYS